jgi:hypothetical protein
MVGTPAPSTAAPVTLEPSGPPSSNNITIIIAGCVAGVLFVVLALFLLWKWRRNLSRRGEDSPLIQHEDGHGAVDTYGGGGMDQTTWKYGELDPAGVKRVLQWVQDVRNAQNSSGITPIVEEEIVDSSLLGQQDDIGSPPQGYSPRVSNIGSDDGRSKFRDELQRGGYRDPLSK